MTVRSYERHNCPIAQALRVVGDQWTLLIVRDLLAGPQRFEALQRSLGISRNLLTRRLRQLVDDGLVLRERIDGTRRYQYRATQTCRDLRIAILALAEWGERWRPDPAGPRLKVHSRDDGAPVGVRLCRLDDGREVTPDEIAVERRTGTMASA